METETQVINLIQQVVISALQYKKDHPILRDPEQDTKVFIIWHR